MRRRGVIAIDEYYHVYNRGVDKRVIFLDTNDYHRFLMLLYLCNSKFPVNLENQFRKDPDFTKIFELDRGEPLVAIGAWCLMPNHFHLLCKEVVENGLQRYMHKVSLGYSMYFNTKNNRTGALFEGRFKAQHADSDEYLKYLYAYIYLNPIKLIPGERFWKEKGIADIRAATCFLQEYPYSSWPLSKNSGLFRRIITPEKFPDYYDDVLGMQRDILGWLSKDSL